MARTKHAALRLERDETPAWRADAVELLFATYWDDRCEPSSSSSGALATPQALAQRRAREWEGVFERLGACGAWEILFPREEHADTDHVCEIAERFCRSALLEEEVRADARRVQRVAREIRREVDGLLLEADEGEADE